MRPPRASPFMSDAAYFLEQAARCRRLAAELYDPADAKMLLELAEDFERRAAELTNEPRPPLSG